MKQHSTILRRSFISIIVIIFLRDRVVNQAIGKPLFYGRSNYKKIGINLCSILGSCRRLPN